MWTQDQGEMARTISWWLECVVQLFLTLLGLLANSLSIFILTRAVLSNKTFNQLLTALAIADSIFLFIMCYESIGRTTEIPGWDYVYGLLTPYFLYPVKAIAMTGSVYIMISVAVERYIAVYHPFNRIPQNLQQGQGGSLRSRVIVYLLPVILFSIVFNITKFMESRYIPEKPYVTITKLRVNPAQDVRVETISP